MNIVSPIEIYGKLIVDGFRKVDELIYYLQSSNRSLKTSNPSGRL